MDHALDRQSGVAGELDRPGVGEFAAQFLVGLLDRHRRIEAVVVDLVGIKCVEELPVTVAGQLLRLDAAREFLPRRRNQQVGRQRHRDVTGHLQGSPAEAGRRRLRRAPERPHRQRDKDGRRRCEPQQDRRQSVRLADVADHLARVDQVIDRDEVEARRKFVPEHEFRCGRENKDAECDRGQRNRRRTEGPARTARRPGPGEQRNRQQPESRGRQVVSQPDQQPPGNAPGHELRRLAIEDRQSDTRKQTHREIGDDDDAGNGKASGEKPLERASQGRAPGREDVIEMSEKTRVRGPRAAVTR